MEVRVTVTAIDGSLSPEKKHQVEEILGRLLGRILEDLDLARVLDGCLVKDHEGEAERG